MSALTKLFWPSQKAPPPKNKSKLDCPSQALQILLAESNSTSAYVVAEMLKDAGHSVHHAANGQSAVAHATSEKFDLILMDISMPDIDGKETAALIRANCAQNTNTRIIALSASDSAMGPEQILPHGFDDYLKKPISKERLLRVVKEGHRAAPHCDAQISRKFSQERDVIDKAEFYNFVKDRSIARASNVVDIFVNELSEKATQLKALMSHPNSLALGEIAHSMIGSAGLLGAVQLLSVSRAVEQRCASGVTFCADDAIALLTAINETTAAFAMIKTEAQLASFISMLTASTAN